MNRSGIAGGNLLNQQQKPHQTCTAQTFEQQQQSGIFSTASNLLTGASNTATSGLFGNRHPKGPQVTPQMGGSMPQQQSQQPINSKTTDE